MSGASAVRERADRDTVEAEVAGAAAAAPATEARGWAGIGDVAVLLGLCLIGWVLTSSFAQPDLMVAYGIAPEVVPRAVIVVIAALALLLLLQELGLRHGRPHISLHPRIPAVLFVLAALTVYCLDAAVLRRGLARLRQAAVLEAPAVRHRRYGRELDSFRAAAARAPAGLEPVVPLALR